MDGSTNDTKETSSRSKTHGPKLSFWHKIILFLCLLGAVFLAGSLTAWLSGRETSRQLSAAQANLRLSQLQNRLAATAINANNGEYEPARVAASDFFTDLRAEVARSESAFTAEQRKSVQTILDQRDDVITQLARYDSSAAERVVALYRTYVEVMSPDANKQ